MNREIARECLSNGGRKTTEEEIDRFLKAFEDGIPIMPVEFFCGYLKTWGRVSSEPKAVPLYPDENEIRRKNGEAIQGVFTDIMKSNLLARLIYGGEKLRTKPCPIHNGRWSGCKLPEETGCKGACLSGMNVTGWLPEP